MSKIKVVIDKVEKIGNQTHVQYKDYDGYGCAHPSLASEKEGQTWEIEIDSNDIRAGTKVISAKLVSDPIWL